MKNNKLVGLGLALVIIIVGYFILNPGKQPKYLVHRYPFSLDVFKQVSLTTYTTDSNETDSTKKHRVIAISRDLKELFSFGDKVMLSNAGKYNGIWFIHDLMNKRWKNKIDILINPDDRQMSLKGVVISKI
jgi:3D (Asp-Asp-Asp) domain-containing protein